MDKAVTGMMIGSWQGEVTVNTEKVEILNPSYIRAAKPSIQGENGKCRVSKLNLWTTFLDKSNTITVAFYSSAFGYFGRRAISLAAAAFLMSSGAALRAEENKVDLECKGTYTTRNIFGLSVDDAYTIFRIDGGVYTTDDGGTRSVLINDGTAEWDSSKIYLTDDNGLVHSIDRNSGLFTWSRNFWGSSITFVRSNIVCTTLVKNF